MPYDLSTALVAHSDDVKCVVPVSIDAILSASRDATVGVWQRQDDGVKFKLERILAGHQGYVNALEFIPSDDDCSIDLIASSGNASLILLHSTLPTSSAEPLDVLSGHHANVCALTYSRKKRKLLSASWDCAARVWSRLKRDVANEDDAEGERQKGKLQSKAGNWECELVLSGHEAAVWGVGILDEGQYEGSYLTGSADHSVKLFSPEGHLLRTFPELPDAVRSIGVFPGSETFAIALNDTTVRILDLEGKVRHTLEGHTDYVYHVAVNPQGKLLSCGEDHTVRIWQDTKLQQTLLHPCQTVWCASWLPNGDVVSAGSDRIIRVWSEDEERWGDKDQREAHDEETKAIYQKYLASKFSQPAPSNSPQEPGSGFVLDVDVADDQPPLQLHFNRGSDPRQIAVAFGQEHGLSENYVNQIEEFVRNTLSWAT